jgi:hypothetical protein
MEAECPPTGTWGQKKLPLGPAPLATSQSTTAWALPPGLLLVNRMLPVKGTGVAVGAGEVGLLLLPQPVSFKNPKPSKRVATRKEDLFFKIPSAGNI